MKYTGLNTNNDRQKFWDSFSDEKEKEILQLALSQIDPISAQVLSWHYTDGYSFQEITKLLNRSISIVRNHHNRGIFELQQFFKARDAVSSFGAPIPRIAGE